jgi:hypothetical protein
MSNSQGTRARDALGLQKEHRNRSKKIKQTASKTVREILGRVSERERKSTQQVKAEGQNKEKTKRRGKKEDGRELC